MTEEEPKGKEGKFKESETVEQGPSQPPKTRRDSQTTFGKFKSDLSAGS